MEEIRKRKQEAWEELERVNPAENKEKKLIQEECEEALKEGTTKDRLKQLLAKANDRLKRATERTNETVREVGSQDGMLIQWKKKLQEAE